MMHVAFKVSSLVQHMRLRDGYGGKALSINKCRNYELW